MNLPSPRSPRARGSHAARTVVALGALAGAIGFSSQVALAATTPSAAITTNYIGPKAGGDAPSTLSLVNGGTSVLSLGMSYTGTTITGPMTIVVTLPSGMALQRITTVQRITTSTKPSWNCTGTVPTLTCQLNNAGTSTPYALPPDTTVEILITMKGGPEVATVVAGGAPIDAGQATATVSVPTDAGVLTGDVTQPAQAVDGPLAPRILLGQIPRPGIVPTGSSSLDGYDILPMNVGGTAASKNGSQPTLQLTKVLPANRFARTTITGSGWKCTLSGQGTCTMMGSIAPGTTADVIKVRWPSRLDAKGLSEDWDVSGTAGVTTATGTAIAASLNALPGADPQPNVFPITEHFRLHGLRTITHMALHVSAQKGVNVLAGRAGRTFVGSLHNTGKSIAAYPAIRVSTEKGVTATIPAKGWKCSGSAPSITCDRSGVMSPGDSVRFPISISAAATRQAGQSKVTFAPLGKGHALRGESRTIPITVVDPGDPQATPELWYQHKGVWEQWRSGGTERIPSRDAFTYRINLVNKGGDAVAPGATVTVSQTVGKAMALQSITPSTGMTCAQTGSVSCTMGVTQAVAPGGTIAQILVTVKPPSPIKAAPLGVIKGSISGGSGPETLPMRVEVTDNPNSLRPSMKVTRIPSAGGVGSVSMVVENGAVAGVTGLTAHTTIPAGITVSSVTGPGWSCGVKGTRLTCSYPSTLKANRRTPGVVIKIRAGPTHRPATDTLRWDAKGVMVGVGTHQRGMRKGPLPVRGPITVAATAAPAVITAKRHMTAVARRVALDGTQSTGNGVSLDYTWRQRCTTAADTAALPACKGQVDPVAPIRRPHVGSTHAVLPVRTTRTEFLFELTITDGSATASKRVSVIEAVPAKVSKSTSRTSGASTKDAAARSAAVNAQKAAARSRNQNKSSATAARRSTAQANIVSAKTANSKAPHLVVTGGPIITSKPGETVDLRATAVGRWSGAVEYTWTQVTGPATEIVDAKRADASVRMPDEATLLAYRVSGRDEKGQTSSGIVMVSTGVHPSGASESTMNKAASVAARGGTMPVAFGTGVSGTISRVKASAGANAVEQQQDASSYSFSGSKFTVGSVTIGNSSGTLSLAGVTLTSGSVTLPSGWNIGPISISGSSPLIITFAEGSTPASLVGQLIAANSFALLPLPSGWAGNTTLTFGTTSSTLDATATGDGDGSVSATGTIGTDGTYNVAVTADNVLHIGSAPINLSGSVTNQGGSVQSTITGTLTSPTELASGVSVQSLTATWTPQAANGPVFVGSGSINVASGSSTPLTLNANLSYTSTTTWNLTLTGSGGPTWTPLPGLNLSASNFSGAVGQTKGAWAWNIIGTVPTWKVSSVLTLNNTTIDLTDQCTGTGTGGSAPCPGGSMFLELDTNAVLDPPLISPINLKADAIIGLGDGGGFSLAASMGNVDIAPGISLSSPALNVTYDMPAGSVAGSIGAPTFTSSSENGFSITALGGLSVPGIGSFSSIAANISSTGWSLGGFDPDGVSMGSSSNGNQSGTYFGWSSFAATMTADLPVFGTQVQQLTPGTISVLGGFAVPSWFGKITGKSVPLALGQIQFNPSTGFFNAGISIPGAFDLPGGGSSINATSLSFDIENDMSGLTVSVGASTALTVKGMSGASQAPTLDLTLAFDVTTQNVEASMSFVDPAGWQNAFGVDGLVVNDASFTLMINLDTMTPGLKLIASGSLPSSVAGPFQVPGQGIPITVGAELALTNPCVEFQVGDSTGTQPVLQMDGGAITANYFEFILAPDGCQLSPQSAPITPGFQMAFDGSVLGTTVDVSASLQLAPTTKFTASIAIGAFHLGGMQFEQTTIGVSLDEQAGINDVSFSGGFSIFGNGISVAGSLDQNGPTTTATLSMAEQGTFQVAGFSLTNMNVQTSVTFGPGVENLSIAASGKVSILGQMVDVQQFDATIDNGVVEDVQFNISTAINVQDVATATGDFAMNYQASTDIFDLNAQVVLSTSAGFSIGTPANPATLNISPQCSAFEGELAIGSVFDATLSGTIAYQDGCQEQVQNAQGQMVTPNPGDFSFAADNVAINIGPFSAGGSVSVGNISGVAYAQLATTLKLSPQSSSDEVSIAGEFQSNGNFAFTGNGQLDLAGFDLQMAVNASNQNGNVSVGGSTQLSIAGTSVSIAGEFSEVSGVPSTTLTGSINALSLGGYDVGNASVTLSQTPEEISVQAAVNMSVGSASTGEIAADGAITFVEPLGGGAPLFYASLNATLGIPSFATMTGAVTFTDCVNNCTQLGPVDFTMNGTLGESGFQFTTSVNMSSTGDFTATANFGDNMCTGTINLLVVRAEGCFDYNIGLWIGSSAPYGSLTATAGANVDIQTWDASPWYEPWKWSWGSWHSFGVSISADVQLDPFKLCVGVMGQNLCT